MPLIDLEDVYKIYNAGTESEVRALAGVSLSIEPGEFVAVMGPSGSGKSTLMNLLGCLDRPTKGRYLLNGEDVSRLGKNQLAEVRNRMLGFVFQNFNLLPRMSALENVELPLVYANVPSRERKKRSSEALTQVGLGNRQGHHPNQLSGGQQQRVAIARALVGRPKIIFADEPTGNLDSHTSMEVMAMLQSLAPTGITVALVTHEPDIAEFASRVVVVKDGIIVRDERREPKRAVVPVNPEHEP
ncbi:MAG TPA: ABC transporter ATP-binding protein [Polyangiaceae bacterium]|nr:ABC transporter ATP-binding protein [Polyangiaceae bacterium]